MPGPWGRGGDAVGGGIRALLDALAQVGNVDTMKQGMEPFVDPANQLAEQIMTGGARDDGVMGAAPGIPPGGAMGGMGGRLRNFLGGAAKRGYQGSAPLAGSRGIPHTSSLPNELPPTKPPPGGPSGGGFGDNMSGTIRGDIAPPPRPGADFAAMDDMAPLGGKMQQGFANGIDSFDPMEVAQVQGELQELSQVMGHEDAILELAKKYGNWVMNLL